MTGTCWSRRAIIIASILFLLIISPDGSQAQAPLQMLRGRNRLIFKRSPTPTPAITPNLPSLPPVRDVEKIARAARINPTPSRVEVSKPVQFKIVFQQPPPSSWNLEYEFNFGDDSEPKWTSALSAEHDYKVPTTYHPFVRIGFAGKPLDVSRIVGSQVDVYPRPSPTATATSPAPRSSPTSSAAASVPRSSPTPARTATSAPISPSPPSHYSTTPTATATATATRAPTATPGATATRTPTATPTRPPFIGPTPQPWWLSKATWSYVVLIAFGLAAAALFGILKLIKPTFRLHWNRDEPQKPLENLTINYELHFYSNVSAGQDRLEVPGANLILAKRTI